MKVSIVETPKTTIVRMIIFGHHHVFFNQETNANPGQITL